MGFIKILNQHNGPARLSCLDRVDLTSGCEPVGTTETSIKLKRREPLLSSHAPESECLEKMRL